MAKTSATPSHRAPSPKPSRPKAPSVPDAVHASNASRPALMVRALRMGYYNHVRRRENDVFALNKLSDFSAHWMAWESPNASERITTGNEDLRRQHDEIMKLRAPAQLTDDSVI